MNTHDYVGVPYPCIEIDSPKDTYTLLDWLHSQFMTLQEKYEDKGQFVMASDFEKAANYICELMDKVEADGFGDQHY